MIANRVAKNQLARLAQVARSRGGRKPTRITDILHATWLSELSTDL